MSSYVIFGGLTEEEVATALPVSRETVKRDWRLVKSWLWRQHSEEVVHAT